MNISMSTNSQGGAKRVRKISDAELSKFLLALSGVYRDEKTGNVGLSIALEDLARSLIKKKPSPKQLPLDLNQSISDALRDADFSTLNDLLDDDGLTKNELIRVGNERFGIPRSRLNRLNREDVKAELKSAMLHEESLKIISQEAKKGGSNRVS